MPDQRPSEIIVPALAQYLAANTDIDDWMFYGDIVAPGSPKGAIAVTRLSNPKRWQISVRVTIAQTTEDPLIREATRWLEYLPYDDGPMRTLWRDGYTATISDVTLSNAFKGIEFIEGNVKLNMNQDGGGIAQVNWIFNWQEIYTPKNAGFF